MTTPQIPALHEPWPEGVAARYLTAAYATVDVLGIEETTAHEYVAKAYCHGCDREQRGQRGSVPDVAASSARDWAQEHAEKCRALPKPEGW